MARRYEEEANTVPCPCKKGTITWTFHSPIYAFGEGWESDFALSCAECSKEWKVTQWRWLENKADAGLAAAAAQEWSRLEREGTIQECTEAGAACVAAHQAIRRFKF